MIINEELFAIQEQCDVIIEHIRNSTAMHEFKEANLALEQSSEAQEKIEIFNEAKDKFTQIEAYGEYAPDYTSLRNQVFQAKRVMDMDEAVYTYRIAERNLQVQLDLIAKKIATSVSENILVSAGDAFSLSIIGLPTACEIHLGKREQIEL